MNENLEKSDFFKNKENKETIFDRKSINKVIRACISAIEKQGIHTDLKLIPFIRKIIEFYLDNLSLVFFKDSKGFINLDTDETLKKEVLKNFLLQEGYEIGVNGDDIEDYILIKKQDKILMIYDNGELNILENNNQTL